MDEVLSGLDRPPRGALDEGQQPEQGRATIEHLEREGLAAADLVERVAAVLGINAQTIAEMGARDDGARQAAFEAWASVPQPMELYISVAGVACRLPLADGLTEQQAIAYAIDGSGSDSFACASSSIGGARSGSRSTARPS